MMSQLETLFDHAPELILKSAQAGRLILENTFQSAGMPRDDAVARVDAIVAAAKDFVPRDLTFDDAESPLVLDRIKGRLDAIAAEHGGEIARQLAALGTGLALSDQTSETKMRWVVMALLVYVNLVPGFSIDSEHTWAVSNTPMVQEIVSRVLDTVDRGIEAWKQAELAKTEEPRDGGSASGSTKQAHPPSPSDHTGGGHPASHPDHAAPSSRPSRNQHAGLVPEVTSGTRTALARVVHINELTDSKQIGAWFEDDTEHLGPLLEQVRVDLGNNNFGLPNRGLAMSLRDRVYTQLNLAASMMGPPTKDARSYFRGHIRSWSREAPVTFDVGIVPTRIPDCGDVVYRLAVRVQAPSIFTTKRWSDIYKVLGAALRGVASIRSAAETKVLARAPGGFRRGQASRIQAGHGVSVRGGDRGTIGCIAIERDTNRHLLVTAGHVVSQQQEVDSVNGIDAFSPPYGDPGDKPIGTVYAASFVTRPWRQDVSTLLGLVPETDIAGIAIFDASQLAGPDTRLRDGVFQLQRATVEFTDQDLITGDPVIKGTSLTDASQGVVTALQVAVNITYPQTLRTVCASNLIEVGFDREVKSGESGTACYDKSGRLMGIVMAGTRVADNKGAWRHIAYVQPVHEWFVGRGWEVF
nr:hypothetical protein [uncultured Rhodopila sp.]